MKLPLPGIKKNDIYKVCIIFILWMALIFLSFLKVQAQVASTLVQRAVWDGPFDIKMIGSPNLVPVFVNPGTATASPRAILADSLIRQSVITRTADLINFNNDYKGTSPFVRVDIPKSAFLCPGDPNGAACTAGLLSATPNLPACPVRYGNPDYFQDMYVSMSYSDFDTDMTTYSSSMAQLDISSCSEIEAAYLYWAGMFQGSNANITLMDGPTNSFNGVNAAGVFNVNASSGYEQVKFKLPGGSYQSITADNIITPGTSNKYICVKDVTTLVQGTGSGQFWVGNIQSFPIEGGGGSSSGWALVVIFKSPLSSPRRICLWDGYDNIPAAGKTITLTGLQAPSTANFNSYVGFGALDAEDLAADIIGSTPVGMGFQTNGGSLVQINPFATDQPPYRLYKKNGHQSTCDGDDNIDVCKKPLSDANTCMVYDGIASSHITTYNEITNKNGNEIVRLPSNTNTLGVDLHHMKLPAGAVASGATTATITLKSGDSGGYDLFLAYIAIERLQPKLIMTKVADKNETAPGTTITYTLRIKNAGNTPSLGNDNIFDTLDIATNYAGPLTSKRYVNGVVTSPAPGVTLATSAGDNLRFNLANPIGRNDSIDIIFTVNVVTYASNPSLFDSPNCKRTIINNAYVRYNTAVPSVLESKSNSNDCGIGSETRVLISGLPAPSPIVRGPFNACPYINESVIAYVRQELVNAGVAASVVDEFDIRNSGNVRVQTTETFATTPTMSYFAYRDFVTGLNCQQIYEIRYISCTLPVEWLSFTGYKNDLINTLYWSTASETNNEYFIIERSFNGIDFVSIGTIQGSGNTSAIREYRFYDEQPLNGINYYRLRQVDHDGSYNYSKVISVSNKEGIMDIYPNPNNGKFTINLFAPDQKYSLEITEVNGKNVYTKSGSIVPQTIEVNDLAKGFYILRFYLENDTHIKKMIVY